MLAAFCGVLHKLLATRECASTISGHGNASGRTELLTSSVESMRHLGCCNRKKNESITTTALPYFISYQLIPRNNRRWMSYSVAHLSLGAEGGGAQGAAARRRAAQRGAAPRGGGGAEGGAVGGRRRAASRFAATRGGRTTLARLELGLSSRGGFFSKKRRSGTGGSEAGGAERSTPSIIRWTVQISCVHMCTEMAVCIGYVVGFYFYVKFRTVRARGYLLIKHLLNGFLR